jgi:hypothetical protein
VAIKTKTNPRGSGRKKIVIPDDDLINFMRTYPTMQDTCAFFKCNADTIRRKIKEVAGKDVDFSTFREENMAWSRYNLKRKAYQMAMNGDKALMIFMLKNWCGFSDYPIDDSKPAIVYQLPESLKIAGSSDSDSDHEQS